MRFLSPGTMTILILAILVGLVAAYGVRGLLVPQPTALPPEPVVRNVPLASANLPAGRAIVEGDMALVPMTLEQMEEQPWGKFLARIMMGPEQIIGRTLSSQVEAGSPFMTSDLFLQGEGPNLIGMLRPGYRAISVQVPFERGGYVTLGATVDVMFRSTFRPGDESTPPVPEKTIVLVENAEVVAVERSARRIANSVVQSDRSIDLRMSNRPVSNEPAPATIVLSVTPDQANKIEAVRNHGEFTLLTRPEGETNYGGPPPPTSLEDVLGLQPLTLEEPSRPAITEIYRRGQRQVNAFQLSGGRYTPVSTTGGR